MKTIELTEQEVSYIKYNLETVLDHHNCDNTTKVILSKIISKLEE